LTKKTDRITIKPPSPKDTRGKGTHPSLTPKKSSFKEFFPGKRKVEPRKKPVDNKNRLDYDNLLSLEGEPRGPVKSRLTKKTDRITIKPPLQKER
jgi:hypothetical protein